MVLAFLRAEVDSPRFSELYRDALSQIGWDRAQMIDRADLSDAQANFARAFVLRHIRGYGANNLLFSGFPVDAQWRRVEIVAGDFNRLMYANYSSWLKLSEGTRRVVDGARNARRIDTEANEHILAVAELVASGVRFPELIAAEAGDLLILMEGHTRATSYVVANAPGPFAVLVASSPSMSDWAFY